MSRKLLTKIQDTKGIPGRHKRVLLAYASFANNDGTNIFPSKEKVAQRAGVCRSTIYHNTEYLLKAGVLAQASSHSCRNEKCAKGGTHYTGKQGQYTAVYSLKTDDVTLQNYQRYLLQNPPKVSVQKLPKVSVQKLDTTQALSTTPAPLGKETDSSALTGGELVSQSVSSVSLRSTSIAADAAPSLESKDEQDKFVVFEQDKSEPDPKDREIADMLGHTLHEEFGVPYITADQGDALLMIAHMSRTWAPLKPDTYGTRAAQCYLWAKSIARWSTQHRFWSQRTFTPDQLAKHMNEDTGKGVCAQYNKYLLKREGQAAGYAYFAGDTLFHAALWKHVGNMTDLGSLGSDSCSYATGINADGQVVGGSLPDCNGDKSRAFLWEDGSIFDLNALIPPGSPLYLRNLSTINDHGEIAGEGVDNSGNGHAFLLIPCDENHAGVEGCDYSVVDAAAAQSAAPRYGPSGTERPSQSRRTNRHHIPGLQLLGR